MDTKKTVMTGIKVAVLFILFIWIVIVFMDYLRVRSDKNPMFCLSKVENKYDDGTTTICTGIGYKTIHYNRDCLTASEFGPFIIKERSCDSSN